MTKPLTEQEIERVFRRDTTGGSIPSNHFQYGKAWIGTLFTYRLMNKESEYVAIEKDFTLPDADAFKTALAHMCGNPLQGKQFRRILADRDVRPEGEGGSITIFPDGTGATTVIQSFINLHDRDRSLVEEKLLHALNSIFNPDAKFDRILVRKNQNGAWEIYLDEKSKGLIPLSNSGSGLKTVILVLINVILMPAVDNRELNAYIFAFEELENNLHPGLQRRLLSYVRDLSQKHDMCFVITTHSNVIIDLFSKDENAQIVHVTHNGEYAIAKTVQTYIDNKGVLDDLDVRASDLLQANAIVWVEGPSDRLYFNKWMELFSGGVLKEGIHYQCIFYGGRLLSHLTAVEQGADLQDEVNLLKVNRNAIVLIDSDKRNQGSKVGANKRRLAVEVRDAGGMSWITFGKEIENYVPIDALQSKYPSARLPQITQYEAMEEYLAKYVGPSAAAKYLRDKVLFAEQLTVFLTVENLTPILDLAKKANDVVSRILEWNSQPMR